MHIYNDTACIKSEEWIFLSFNLPLLTYTFVTLN